ncbi:response regulator [Cardiobacteriaceae bacterium TAE3-ERU3]|nr:response regulator [Cardiobacteriaceae bacterium TAE3-ERU3]
MQTALIVDDSALARLTLKRFLMKHGLEVFEGECVSDCRYWLRHNQLPDVIFMDITMPEEDGFEALAEIRAKPETKHLPVIMYSGDASAESKQKARDGKATGFLRKPVNEEQLAALLEKLKERYPSSPVVPAASVAASGDESLHPHTTSTGEPEPIPVKEVRELRHEVGKVYVKFERQQESLTSLKNMLQRQANDLAHLQNNLQQNERSMKKLSLLAAGAAAIALVCIVLFFVT